MGTPVTYAYTATRKDQKLTSVLMNASATSTIASSRHPRNGVILATERSTYIEKLRQHLQLPHHRLSVHTSTIWRYHKASNLKAICHASSIPQCKNIYLPHRTFAKSKVQLQSKVKSDSDVWFTYWYRVSDGPSTRIRFINRDEIRTKLEPIKTEQKLDLVKNRTEPELVWGK